MNKVKFHWYYPLTLVVTVIVMVGLLVLCSASMGISKHLYNTGFYFLNRQMIYLMLGMLTILIGIRIPVRFWEQMGFIALVTAIIFLALVLVPGIGYRVNGSIRWINFKFFSLQVSELAKFSMLLYGAGYLVRQAKEVKTKITGFLKPMLILAILAYLLLLEPDFGALVVITLTFLSMLYVAEARLIPFILVFLLVVVFLSYVAMVSPYRLARIISFLDPWQHPYDSGYQLIQSLIAFGRGGIWGVGFGNSIQKLFYLPEAHTDFLFAILAEEFGILGGIFLIGLFAILAFLGLKVAYVAKKMRLDFHCYLSFGITISLVLQAVVNICVNAGLLPTKGLTLPFISYGGSNLLFSLLEVAILLRIYHELTLAKPLKL